jgi:hypothetical protein
LLEIGVCFHHTTGANISWQFTRISGRVSVSTVGCSREPARCLPEGNLCPKADNRNGGGRALVLLLGPQAARGHRSTVFHSDQNLLRTWGMSMGFGTLPGGATTFGALGDLFAQ